jgi:hypothetical protein
MPDANVLRYDSVPMEDFLQALTLHEQNADRGALPRPAALRAVRIAGNAQTEKEPYPLELFSIAEYNPLAAQIEAFVVLRAPSIQARELEKLALQVRQELAARGFKTLFRVDPRYGLLSGSAMGAVDPTVRANKPFCFATLYLTDDPAHPALALLDYVDKAQRPRYEQIFKKVNGVSAKGAPSFNFSLSKFLGGKKEPAAPPPAVSPIRYAHLRTLLMALGNKMFVRQLTVSLIFSGVTDREIENCFLDKHHSMHQASGQAQFFASLDELLS